MEYYASEIDKYAISITQNKHPETKQIGDVLSVSGNDYENIDLLIGGSPCQGFSFAGKQLNFEDPRSKLFFEFVRLLKECKPKYFLLENVRMKKEYQDIISGYLGVEPIMIDSNLVSAQNRKRLFWTNIPLKGLPEDKKIMLINIIHESRGEVLFDADIDSFNVNPSGNGMNGNVYPINNEKSKCLTTNKGEGQKIAVPIAKYIVPFDKTLQILEQETKRGRIGHFKSNSQGQRVYSIHGKSVTLCGEGGGRGAKTGLYLFGVVNRARGNNPGGLRNDGSKSPTISSHYWEHNNHLCFGCITPDRVNKRQNGQRFNTGKKFYTLTAQDRHGVLVEGYIRKLTPIECERLQTLPDNYTEGVSDSQRYKALGNGWTVEVIKHIFSFLPEEVLYKDNLKVLSLFDGISCGQQALKELRTRKRDKK